MPLTRAALDLAFQLAPSPQAALEALLPRADADFASETVSALAARLAGLDPTELRAGLAGTASPTGACLAGRLALAAGDPVAARAQFERAQAGLPRAEPELLLQLARLASQEGRPEVAIAELRRALRQPCRYAFHARSEKLVRRLAADPAGRHRRQLKVALIGSSTLDLLAGVLRALCFRDGIDLQLQIGAFNAWQQEILDPGSALYDFAPDLVVILLNGRDLALPATGGEDAMQAFCQHLAQLWTTLLDRHPCHVVQTGFDLPALAPWGSLEDQQPDGRRRLIQAANGLLAALRPHGVSLLDPVRLQQRLGAAYDDPDHWHQTRQHPAPEALPELAEAIVAQCRAVLGLSGKVLVTDLDQTLWGGIVGEDGLDGLVLGPPDPRGEAHQMLQRYLKDLHARGILLAVCSKNNPGDALAPFENHPEMVLKRGDVALFVANWNDKASNLRQIADDLDLGLDSLVFIDDNPVERGWVEAQLPEVTVVDADGPLAMLAALERGRFFETVSLTTEDQARAKSYEARAKAKVLAASAVSPEAFLASLSMVARHGPVEAASLQRVTQLINKTNQFNLTTRRYSQQQVAELAAAPDWWLRWFRLADRYGDHGLIGVLAAEIEGPVWRVDLWLMSCRVLGRGMEGFMFAILRQAAAAAGAKELTASYLPSAKNGQMADLLPRFGFLPAGSAPAGDGVKAQHYRQCLDRLIITPGTIDDATPLTTAA